MINKKYIRNRHKFPAIPDQDIYLEPYCNDTANEVKKLNRLFNIFTNFNKEDIYDIEDTLPEMYGKAHVYKYADKTFQLDMSGNNLIVGPGVAIMEGTIVDFTGYTSFDITSDDSWWNLPPLSQVYPPNDDHTDYELMAILSLYKYTDSINDEIYMCLNKVTDYNVSAWRSRALPIQRINFLLDSNYDVSGYELFEAEAWHDTSDPPDTDGTKLVKYKQFPFYQYISIDGGYPFFNG